MKTRMLMGVAAVALAATAAFADGHGDEPAAVKARKAHMQLYSFNLGILGAMAKGEADYNADIASAAANDLAALTKQSQMSYWPADTSRDQVPTSRALPVAWEKMEDVITKAQALTEAADKMAADAGSGIEGIQSNMQAVGGACGACHKAYRHSDS